MVNRYKQRDAVLLELGFSSYADYLNSDLWRKIRARVLQNYGFCQCGAVATEVHHLTYKKKYLLGRGMIFKFLKPICRECHQKIEFLEDGTKTALGQANARLAEIASKSNTPNRMQVKPRPAMVTCKCGKVLSEKKLPAHLRTSRKCPYSTRSARNGDR